jgi:glycosyltransferase involved in cell wall biosynthesis
LLELSVPDYLAKSREAIRALCERWQIDVILCLSPGIAEIVVDMDVPKILEYCDSGTLTLQRVLANRGSSLSVLDRAKVHLRKARQGSLERTFLRTFDHATTISSADKQSFLDVAQISPDKVTVVPNGVDEKALAAGDLKCERQRSVVFWGNLDFPPNWTAVEYFFDSIYRPYLSNAKVEWHIFGRGASERLEQIARHENVYLHGFVDDLFSEVAKQGIMINSMVEGSGLKNKVLEAFACRVPVVSTSLGIEAIDAVPDRHYVKADDPREFAAAIIRLLDDQVRASIIAEEARRLAETGFRWTVIGDQLGQLVDRIACRDAARHARTA